MMPVRGAIVGVGMMGRKHTQIILASPIKVCFVLYDPTTFDPYPGGIIASLA